MYSPSLSRAHVLCAQLRQSCCRDNSLRHNPLLPLLLRRTRSQDRCFCCSMLRSMFANSKALREAESVVEDYMEAVDRPIHCHRRRHRRHPILVCCCHLCGWVRCRWVG